MNRLYTAALFAACVLAVPAFAKGTPPPAQNHQCMKEGQVLQKTKKECLKDGGKWEKMAASEAKPADSKMPASKPADMKPADTKPAEPKPAAKPAEPKPVEPKGTGIKADDPKM